MALRSSMFLMKYLMSSDSPDLTRRSRLRNKKHSQPGILKSKMMKLYRININMLDDPLENKRLLELVGTEAEEKGHPVSHAG